MTIKDVHDIILFVLNKEQNAYFSHEEIDIVLDKVQMALFNEYITNPKLPTNNPVATYGSSQMLDDALSPFKVKVTFTNVDTPSGILTLPSDYQYLISLYTTVYNSTLGRNIYNAVQVLNEQELIERLESQVIPVTSDDPIAIMNSQNRIQLFPESACTGGYFYFRRPAVPKFGYTVSGRVMTYNPTAYNSITQPTGSTQLEWKDNQILNIVSKALSYYGLNMSAQDVMQFGEIKNQQGQ